MARMRYGIARALEDEADAIIARSMEGQSTDQKSDILTAWKSDARRRREVYVSSGVPDPAVRSGVFGRAANTSRPELNSRDGIARAHPRLSRHGTGSSVSSLSDFVASMIESGSS